MGGSGTKLWKRFQSVQFRKGVDPSFLPVGLFANGTAEGLGGRPPLGSAALMWAAEIGELDQGCEPSCVDAVHRSRTVRIVICSARTAFLRSPPYRGGADDAQLLCSLQDTESGSALDGNRRLGNRPFRGLAYLSRSTFNGGCIMPITSSV